MAATTLDRVLETAGQLIATRGYDGFSIADLVAGSGVSSGSIYHHFGAKDGVLAALLLAAVEDYQRHLLTVLEDHADDAEGGIHAVVTAHLEWMQEHRREASLLLTYRDTVRSGAHGRRLKALNRRFLAVNAAWLERQAAAGRMPPVAVEIAHAVVFAPAQELWWLTDRTAPRHARRSARPRRLGCAPRHVDHHANRGLARRTKHREVTRERRRRRRALVLSSASRIAARRPAIRRIDHGARSEDVEAVLGGCGHQDFGLRLLGGGGEPGARYGARRRRVSASWRRPRGRTGRAAGI
jgi:AcrR family transcriptional regulator